MSPGWWSLSSLSRLKCCGGLPPQCHRTAAGRPHLTATCSHAMGCLANAHVEVKWCQQRCSKQSVWYQSNHVQEYPQKPTWGSESFALSSGTNSVQSVTIHRFVHGLSNTFSLSLTQHEIWLLCSQCAWLAVSCRGECHRMHMWYRSVLRSGDNLQHLQENQKNQHSKHDPHVSMLGFRALPGPLQGSPAAVKPNQA